MSLNPFKNRRITNDGTPGIAVIVAYDGDEALRRSGGSGDGRFPLTLSLEVRIEGRRPWRTEGDFWVPTGLLRSPGQHVTCRVGRHPADVVLDWEGSCAQAQLGQGAVPSAR